MLIKFLDHSSSVPLYHQLKDIFLRKISEKEWNPGHKIPTENELIAQYKVSRTTVREAINELVHDGLLEKKQGRGTIVCHVKMEEKLGKLTGFAEEMEEKGLHPSAKLISAKKMKTSVNVQKKLGLTSDENILAIRRIRLADGEPIAIENSYWPEEIGDMLLKNDLESAAFYQIIENQGIPLKEADEFISATAATKEEADWLGVPEDSPLLQMERIVYSVSGIPVEFTRTKYRSERYTYRVHLSR